MTKQLAVGATLVSPAARSIAGRRKRRPYGFTFTEVLFAVILLGVGFIMLAAMFPVAIRQTQTSIEETAGAWLSSGAVKTVQQATSAGLLPPTGNVGEAGKVASFRDRVILGDVAADSLWTTIRGNLILTQDPRYAWVPLYRRNNGDNFAQVILIGVICRNRSRFDPNVDLVRWQNGAVNDVITYDQPSTLEPRPIDVTLTRGANTNVPDTVAISGAGADAVGEGAYIVISDDTTNTGKSNGFIYRVGNRVSGNTWELQPGSDLKAGNISSIIGRAFVVGRGCSDPLNPSKGYEGPVQDVAAYTTFIRLN